MNHDTMDFVVDAVLGQVHALLTEQAQALGLTLQVQPNGVPGWLRGDPIHLRQTLLNHANNAMACAKAAQGPLVLRAVLVEDQGSSILVRFEVQNSVFWFTSWLQRGQGIAPSTARTPAQNAESQLRQLYSGTRILLAEDNEVNREVALELLQETGLVVDVAVDGQTALDKARSQTYALVLLDIQMPKMDGLQVAQAMRLLPGWAHTPIIAMTANTFAEDRLAYRQAGMNDLVGKPIDLAVLCSTLLQWLGARAPATSAVPQGAAPVPAALSPQATRQALQDIEGLDVENGLARIRGNVQGYLRVLRAFVSSHELEVLQLTQALAQQDLDTLREVAHSLQGSGGNIGALRLAETATALAAALRHNAPHVQLEPTVNALVTELKSLLDGVRRALQGL